MFNKTNITLLLIALILIAGCGDGLSKYQSEIVKKAELIISSNNVDNSSVREVRILLGLLYLECVKLKEHNNEGSSYEKLFTTFSNLIPTYRNLRAQEKKRFETMRTEDLIKTSNALVKSLSDNSDDAVIRRRDELETRMQDLENYGAELIADEQALFDAILLITTETQEQPIWAKSKAKEYLLKFNNLIEDMEEVEK